MSSYSTRTPERASARIVCHILVIAMPLGQKLIASDRTKLEYDLYLPAALRFIHISPRYYMARSDAHLCPVQSHADALAH